MVTKKVKNKKDGVSAPVKFFFTLGVLAVLLFIGFFFYAGTNYNPEAVVDEYVKSFLAKSPSRIFNTLDLKASEFINPDRLESFLDERADFKKITSYSLVRLSETDEECKYTVNYMMGRLQSPFSQTLTLKKREEKVFLFFERWYIDGSDLIAKNITIRIPLHARLKLDDMKLGREYLRRETETTSDYEIGDLFIGDHEITVELDGFEPFEKSFAIEAQDYYNEPVYVIMPSQLEPDEKSKNTVMGLNEKITKILYEDMLTRRPYDYFLEEVMVEASEAEKYRKEYDLMCELNIETENHLMSVDFRSFSSGAKSTIATDDCYAMQVDTVATYDAGSTVVTDDVPERKLRRGMIKYKTMFHYSDGQWRLYSSELFGNFIKYDKE